MKQYSPNSFYFEDPVDTEKPLKNGNYKY